MKYHIGKDGSPRPCKAVGACPLGDDAPHGEFDSKEEAIAWAEERNASLAGGSFADLAIKRETESVIDFVKAEDIAEGYLYESSPVVSVKTGSKWVTIDTEDKKGIKLPIGEQTAIVREKETPESKELNHKHFEERVAVNNRKWAHQEYVKSSESIAERAGTAQTLQWSEVRNLLKGNAKIEIWNQVDAIAKHEGISISEAAEKQREYYKENFYKYDVLGSTGSSRSTDQVSNLMDDFRAEAIIEFVRGPF